MTGISVTTKYEKRLYANPLFAVSYGSFQGRPLHVLRGVSVTEIYCQLRLALPVTQLMGAILVL